MIDSPDVFCRPAQADDAQTLRDITEAAFAPFVAAHGIVPAPVTADYDARIREARVVVMMGPTRPLAFLITEIQDDCLLLDTVAVHPEAQGLGLGRRLLDEAEHHAREAKRARIQLYTHAKMTANQSLYERHGYRLLDRRQEAGLDRVYMVKDLR